MTITAGQVEANPKDAANYIASQSAEIEKLKHLLRRGIAACRSSAGPEERQNFERDAKAAIT